MQAIVTKYIGPTDTKGSRIKAWCDAGSITVGYSHGSHDPHDIAAAALIRKLGWNDNGQTWVGGGLPQNMKEARVYLMIPRNHSVQLDPAIEADD